MDKEQFSIDLRLLENYLFEIDFGEFGNIMTDEPPPLGGGEGPGPAMMLAASVANCLAASLAFALRKYKNDPGELKATVTATLERVDKYIRVTGLQVQLMLDLPQAQLPALDKALAQFENYCTVTQSVRQGIPASVEVIDGDGQQVQVAQTK